MEGLVDPRVFESRTGLLVGVALLAVFLIAAVVGYAAEAVARRTRRAVEAERDERAPVDNEETEQTRKAA